MNPRFTITNAITAALIMVERSGVLAEALYADPGYAVNGMRLLVALFAVDEETFQAGLERIFSVLESGDRKKSCVSGRS